MKKENMRKILKVVGIVIIPVIVLDAIMVILSGWSIVSLFCAIAILCANVAIGKIYYSEKKNDE